ncbi:uncharacterized protein [Parasteatoda tepidariorum]|uniref:uncharacterized protein n=1 Tax=Parasteatoda tepidariorum TaxID=114398 RepID=UPI0039BC430F
MKIKSLGKCIDEHVNYPNYEKICAKGYETTTDEIIEDCSKQCQLACQENSYKMVYEELGSEEDKISGGSRSSSKNKILIRFSFRKFRLTRRIYQPKFNDIELFSYVGGYMGMWLGISLVSILDLLESLSMLFCYIVRTKSKKNLIK